MKRYWINGLVLLATSMLPASAKRPAAVPPELHYLGGIAQNKALLAGVTDNASDSNLLISAASAYVVVQRRSDATTATIGYAGGERDLWFTGKRAAFRVLMDVERPFAITATTHGAACYHHVFTLQRQGVWRLDLPC
jgi:hypothetical protein